MTFYEENTPVRQLALVTLSLLGLLGSLSHAAASEPLTLDEAVALSILADDPSVTSFQEMAGAEAELAVAAGQLPDPQVQFRAANVPTDNFRLDREPMTQLQVGVRQAFPRGGTLRLQRERHELQSVGAEAQADLVVVQRVLDTRTVWLEAYYLRGAREAVLASQDAMREFIEVATTIYSTGRSTRQDVLRAELELNALEDRAIDIDGREALARADLERLVGRDAASRPLSEELPMLSSPMPIGVLRDRLVSHPSVAVIDATVDVREVDIGIADEAYRPAWALEAMYGNRADERSDFASIGLTMDMPIFTGQRQDRRLSAARHARESARLTRSAHLLDLERDLNRTYAAWQRDTDRATLYEQSIVPQARATSRAVVDAYRNDVSDFPELIRARLAELDAELAHLRLQIDARQANARLIYLGGEDNGL